MKRFEQNEKDTWDLTVLFASEEEWEQCFLKLKDGLKAFEKSKGTLCQSAGKLAAVIDEYAALNETLERVYVYATQHYHEDTGNSHYQEMAGRAQTLLVQMGDAASWMEPEILALPEEQLQEFMTEEVLQPYQRFLNKILRQRVHTLSEEMEKLMANAREIAGASSNIYSMFQNADLRFQSVHDEKGQEIVLTQGNYISLLENPDRKLRFSSFTSFYASYQQFSNTLAAAFDANCRQATFFAKQRGYQSARAMALDENEIPEKVYDQLIDTVHERMDEMYRYVRLRKKMLKLDEIHMYDVYVPIVEGIQKQYSFEEAKVIVKQALSVLGEDYGAKLEEGFQNRWIDIYENEGKRTGAYSWGAYGYHPYVLLNYQGNLNHVFTLAHEMGHALHSAYSNERQSYLNAGYRIFVAEVASTCNEALLIHYLMEHTTNPKERRYLINYFLDQFKGTLYRQTMFAEFERDAHEKVDQGGTLTADGLCDSYLKLNQQYFGPDMISDPQIAFEWSRIPHFYNSFYVYQYATGFSAAIAISKKILEGEEGIVEHYKKFLSGGDSMDSIALLKLCGVDMTSREPIEAALDVFKEYLEEMERMIDETDR